MTDTDDIRVKVAMAMGFNLSNWQRKTHPCGTGYECSNCGEFVMNHELRELWDVCRMPNRVLPRYPTDHNAAFTLCDRLKSEWLNIKIDSNGGTDRTYWHCEFLAGTEIKGAATDASLPMAICLAFLNVMDAQ